MSQLNSKTQYQQDFVFETDSESRNSDVGHSNGISAGNAWYVTPADESAGRPEDKTHFADEHLIWNVPLHALPNFQGHGYLKGCNGRDTKQYARSHSLNELLFQVIAAHLGHKDTNTFGGVDYTDSIKEAKCILYIPKLSNDFNDEGMYELRRGDIISDFRYERQAAANRNLTGLTTFVFDIDRLLTIDFNIGHTDNINEKTSDEIYKILATQYKTCLSKSLKSHMRVGKDKFEREAEKIYPVLNIKIKKKGKPEVKTSKSKMPKQFHFTTNIESDNPFELLGITPETPAANIKKAYKEACFRYHPDKGGDEVSFKKVQAAYQSYRVRSCM